MNPCIIYLNKGEEKRLKQGDSWVYSNEIKNIKGFIKSGEEALVYSYDEEFIGKGYLNTNSKIFVRILTRDINTDLDYDFFYNKILTAKKNREELGYSNSYRAFFSEADGISGLIIDKYDKYLSIQILSYGLDLRKNMFTEILKDIYKPLGIYERSDVNIRKKEGLESFSGILYGEVPDYINIYENNLKMIVDIKNGQKTGFYLDQQDNHDSVKKYVKDKVILDCFSNIGGFSLHSSYYGCKKVTSVDISDYALELVRKNASLNNLNNIDTIKADVFDLLREFNEKNILFDMVILDPPAFTKNKDNLKKAYKGYKDINLQALKLIKDNGILYTCSCSHYMTIELFLKMVKEAASNCNKTISLLELRIQSKDHPALMENEDSLYLKCAIFRVNNLK